MLKPTYKNKLNQAVVLNDRYDWSLNIQTKVAEEWNSNRKMPSFYDILFGVWNNTLFIVVGTHSLNVSPASDLKVN